jgi:prefoldin subunit 2
MTQTNETISKMTANQLDAAYQQADRERNQLVTKLSELQQESREHLLVLDAFAKVEPTRRCFRLIGGVLVEQTVGEVKDPLTENHKRLEEYVNNLNGVMKQKTDLISAIVQRSNTISKQEDTNTRSNRAPAVTTNPSDHGVLV